MLRLAKPTTELLCPILRWICKLPRLDLHRILESDLDGNGIALLDPLTNADLSGPGIVDLRGRVSGIFSCIGSTIILPTPVCQWCYLREMYPAYEKSSVGRCFSRSLGDNHTDQHLVSSNFIFNEKFEIWLENVDLAFSRPLVSGAMLL